MTGIKHTTDNPGGFKASNLLASPWALWLERWGGWLLIVLLVGIPVARLFMLTPLSDGFATGYAAFSKLGKVMGLTGFMLFAINFVLSSRQRWLENLFGGLNRVYIAHHITGGLALILLLFHPTFLALRYVELSALSTLRDAAQFLLPDPLPFGKSSFELQQALAVNNGMVAFLGMVVLLMITFFVKLPYRVWLFTHKFLGVAFGFAGLHIVLIYSDVYNDAFLKAYLLLWLAVGLVAYVYRTLLGSIFVCRARYNVVSVDAQPGNVTAVTFEPTGKPIDFKPGQFVFVRFLGVRDKGILPEQHPFSITSAPGKNVQLYMKALGDFTNSVKQLPVGATAEIEGAFGRFIPARYSDRAQVWVAGGIGITPFLGNIRSFSADSPRVDFFYSVQTGAELLEQDTIAQYVPDTFSQFSYHPYVTEEQQTLLTAAYIAEHTEGGVADKEIFLCGPPSMMRSLRQQLRDMGVPNKRIHSEEFTLQ